MQENNLVKTDDVYDTVNVYVELKTLFDKLLERVFSVKIYILNIKQSKVYLKLFC